MLENRITIFTWRYDARNNRRIAFIIGERVAFFRVYGTDRIGRVWNGY